MIEFSSRFEREFVPLGLVKLVDSNLNRQKIDRDLMVIQSASAIVC